ncbi:hypothetical protein A2U01_0080664, partial [Trifolium medium]|nr:hypothetical protein [Trifolium medium]
SISVWDEFWAWPGPSSKLSPRSGPDVARRGTMSPGEMCFAFLATSRQEP